MQLENLYRRNRDNHRISHLFSWLFYEYLSEGQWLAVLSLRISGGGSFFKRFSQNVIHLLPAILTVCRASESRRELPPGFVILILKNLSLYIEMKMLSFFLAESRLSALFSRSAVNVWAVLSYFTQTRQSRNWETKLGSLPIRNP